MFRRDFDMELDGPYSKMRKEDPDDGGAAGRSGRVRKKSAKVLEMEEFEQVEKTQYVTKKGKTPKSTGKSSLDEQDSLLLDKSPTPSVTKKVKAPKPTITSPAAAGAISTLMDLTPVTSKLGKIGAVKPEINIQLAKPVQSFLPLQLSSGLTLSQMDLLATTALKPEFETELPMISEHAVHNPIQHSPVKSDDQKSVIKYLLSSPSSSSNPSVSPNIINKIGASPILSIDTSAAGKKPVKKVPKPQESASVKKPKPKRPKADSLSPLSDDIIGMDNIGLGLKMKIFASSDPATAQVSMNAQPEHTTPIKQKRPKKVKQVNHSLLVETADDLKQSIQDTEDMLDRPAKKPKKLSKKKEKLILDAISAAQQMPNLAALVASQTQHMPDHDLGQLAAQVTVSSPGQKPHKPQKKKLKTISPVSMSASSSDDPNDSLGKSEGSYGDDGEEAHLIIAETEKKKKRPFTKKKGPAYRDKSGSLSPKGDSADKKLSKRAPTAYMLFCNTHRPTIVNENPGIEFAGISRKLGEMWQMLSSKQKLQWRRKAQRRRKKGSNLISTGKTGREGGAAILTPASSSQSHLSPGLKLSTFMQKTQRSSPEDTPQSPTKNFSIEPIDVAAHLKLLGESLSIIGMRLQEHKGMIAVQGSLSVLLDSLICACGPLLCLTQQVPGMDGCSPLVHGQTLDSVAYVMPGL